MTQNLIENINFDDLKDLFKFYDTKSIFLVTGKASYESSGAKKFIEQAIEGRKFVRFSEFEQNPKYEQAVKGSSLFIKSRSDIILAIGGGSVIDMAKLINIFAANQDIEGLDIVENSKKIKNGASDLIAIPTTAGTGSEATHFAVVYHEKKKYSVAHDSLLPNVVGLNYRFTMSQPKYLTACAGLDALSQAIESYWSVGATSESMDYAAEAIRLLIVNLETAVNSPDEKSRKGVMRGAYLAGKAINISKTTAPHAVSYAFTTYYAIPHGHAVFLTLPEFFTYNYQATELDNNGPKDYRNTKRIIENLCKIIGVQTVNLAEDYLKQIAANIGVELSFNKLEITDYENKIVENVNLERLGNNPRLVTKNSLRKLLKSKID